MLLFFTRDARFKFSIEDRLAGVGEWEWSSYGLRFSVLDRVGEHGSRLCQYNRGELVVYGDESNGEDSSWNTFFCSMSLIRAPQLTGWFIIPLSFDCSLESCAFATLVQVQPAVAVS